MSATDHLRIAEHYDATLRRFGDTARGADWPSQADREIRFEVMLDLFQNFDTNDVEILDFACGSGDLLRYLRQQGRTNIKYKGADISAEAVSLATAKFPGDNFGIVDILSASPDQLKDLTADYCIINGLFTVRAGLSEDTMWQFFSGVVECLWSVVRKGLAFNVMSKHVDWERDDLFHVPMDRVAALMHRLAGRNVTLRADYGLYEYTCYGYKLPFERRRGPGQHVAPSQGAVSPSPLETRIVCRPKLPSADNLAPRLQRIDESRQYSNWGPLNSELEKRLANLLNLGSGYCVTASSGTAGITGALLATAGRASAERPLCLMPSYTFVATAIGALEAGYRPYFLDIDPKTFALDPNRLAGHPALAKAGAVVAVAPYGQAIDVRAWAQFSRSTRTPVVIDAAASLDSFATRASRLDDEIPVVLSLHATKAFGVGEGGAVLCRTEHLAKKCRRALNFGFLGDRVARSDGINGKLSEYHAAVGLAELEHWGAKRAAYLQVAETYRRLAEGRSLKGQILANVNFATGYILFLADDVGSAHLARGQLSAARIDHRLWYGEGLHKQPAYENCEFESLPMTDSVATRLIGLPCSVDLSEIGIAKVIGALGEEGQILV